MSDYRGLEFSLLQAFRSLQLPELITYTQADGKKVECLFTSPSLPDEKKHYLEKVFSIVPIRSPELFALKSKVQMLATERFFIEKLRSISFLEASFGAMEGMKAGGFSFLYIDRQRSVHLPELPDSTPWPIIVTICKSQRLFASSFEFTPHKDEFRFLVTKLFRLYDQFPRYKESLNVVLANVEYAQWRREFGERKEEMKEALRLMRQHVGSHPDFSFSNGVRLALTAEDDYEKNRTVFAKKRIRVFEEQANNREAMVELATEDDGFQIRFSRFLKKSIDLYNAELPKRASLYTDAYRDLMQKVQEKAKGCNAITKIFSQGERPAWPSLLIPPEQFVIPIPPIDMTSLVAEMRAKRDERSKKDSQPEGNLQREWLQTVQLTPKHIDTKGHSSEVVAKVFAKSRKNPEIKTVPAVLSLGQDPSSSSLSKISISSCRQQEMKESITKVVSLPPPIQRSSPPQVQTNGFEFKVGDGPDPRYVYDFHVLRWYDPSQDPFTKDPDYAEKSYSPSAQEAIRLQHTFGRALHPVIMCYGVPFEKKDFRGNLLRTTYTLLGEIEFPDGGFRKGIFTLAVGADGKIFHAYFTKLTVFEIITRLAKESCYKSDASKVYESVLLKESEDGYLRDDGSRVTFVSSDIIEVIDTKGVIFRVLPFPEV
jgi:hypothetical protein